MACEYVALGAHGKHTLVNAYTGDILVGQYPATFPLAFYIEIVPEPTMARGIKLTITENKKTKIEIEAEMDYEEGKPGLIVLPPLLFKIEEDTTVQLAVSCEGFRKTTLLSKRISLGAIVAG